MEAVKSSAAKVSYQGSATPAAKTKKVENTGNGSNIGDAVYSGQGAYGTKGQAKTIQSEDEVDGKVKALHGAQLDNAISEMNDKMSNSEAIFGIHEKTNRVMIKIIDKTTKEVIKEYPPEETLDMIAKVWEIAGIMVDEKR